MDEPINMVCLPEQIRQLEARLEQIGPLVDALQRIATGDGHGQHTTLAVADLQQIAREALAGFRLAWEPR